MSASAGWRPRWQAPTCPRPSSSLAPLRAQSDMPAEGVERKPVQGGQVRRSAQRRARRADGRAPGARSASSSDFRTHAAHAQHAPRSPPDLGGRPGSKRQDAVVERLFRGYFEEGTGHRPAPKSCHQHCRSRRDWRLTAVDQALNGSDSLEAVTRLEQQGYGMGIQGVPFFILLAEIRHIGRTAARVLARGPAEDRRRGLSSAGRRLRIGASSARQ